MANGAPCRKKQLTIGLIVSKPGSFRMHLEDYIKMKQYFTAMERERESERERERKKKHGGWVHDSNQIYFTSSWPKLCG